VKKLNQKGQALIEYVMLLFIAVLMVIGLVYQFNDAFRQYLNAWFGSNEGYLFCLIQNGYLPGESENCSPPTFNLKNGKKLAADGIGGGGSSKNGAGSGSTNASGNGSGGSNAGNGGSGGGGGGGRANERGSSGSLAPANLTAMKSNAAASGKGGSEGAGGSTGDDGFSSGGGLAPGAFGSRQSSRRNSRYIPYGSDDDDDSGSHSRASTVLAATSEKDIRAARLVAVENARKKRLEDADVNATVSFGNVIKYVAIFVLVFSLIFFIGSMLVAISRGGRKRE
jgi:hypothetical protein